MDKGNVLTLLLFRFSVVETDTLRSLRSIPVAQSSISSSLLDLSLTVSYNKALQILAPLQKVLLSLCFKVLVLKSPLKSQWPFPQSKVLK